MSIEIALARAHRAVTRQPALQLLTVFTRVILAIGFIPPSIPKILHQPFTSLPETNPVGDFFGALYRTGFYYEFIGWGQLIAALLLLFPRTAHLGAFLFLPIIANIAVLTFSVGFEGTVYVTALMLLAVLYLVAWEYDRWMSFVFADRVSAGTVSKTWMFVLPAVGAAGGAVLASFLIRFGIGNLHRRPGPVLLGLTVGGLAFGFVCALHHRFLSTGALQGVRE